MIVTTGSNNKNNNKVYNEVFEILVRKMIMPNIMSELREDGETAYVVKDLDGLIISVMDFIIDQNVKKNN